MFSRQLRALALATLFALSAQTAFAGYNLNPFTNKLDETPDIEEVDGSPSLLGVKKIIVSNGTLAVSGKTATITIGAGGGSMILDLADDGANESTALSEIAVTNDTNAIFSEPSADKLLIDASKNWPKSDNVKDSDFGDISVSSGAWTIDANAVALGTDTTGNYVATIADAGSSTVTVANSGTENAAVTLDVVDLHCTNCIGPTEITDLTLGTDTAGNYVATIADSGASEITVTGSGSETAAITLALASGITRDTEWDTAAEINAATADDDFPTLGGGNVFTNSNTFPASNLRLTGAIGGTMTFSTASTTGGTVLFPGTGGGTVTYTSAWDTIGEIETAIGSLNIILATEIDTSAEIAAIVGDETGTAGKLVFDTAPVFQTSITTPVMISASADPADAGAIRLGNAELIAWEANAAGADLTAGMDANNVFSTSVPINATTGYRIGNAASSGKILIGNGTNFIASTPTYPNSSATSGKVLVSDGTNFIASTPTFPNASATSGKIIKSDGTNWTASTETYAAPSTSGNVMTSDGTNWTSAAASASGSVKSVNQTAHGFSVGDVIKSSGSAGAYAKAKADSAANAEVVGIVTVVTDADNFTYTIDGFITTGVPTATAGTVYYLDPTTAGTMTSTAPTTTGQVVKPVLIVTTSAAGAVFSHSYRGSVIQAAASSTGSRKSIQVFTASGTWTKPAGVTNVVVYVIGGGAGGGNGGSTGSGAGGGGGGGASEEWLTSLGATETVTVGAAAGTSSFGSGPYLQATGGTAGGSGGANPGAGGAAGVGSSGDVNLQGLPGLPGTVNATSANVFSGAGGAAPGRYGGGGGKAVSGNTAGVAGGNYGGGGSGDSGNAGAGGGAGAGGIVVVEEYS